jgi:predicted nucleic acid-binding protein
MQRVFIDTNIIVYAREKDDIKKNAMANNLFKNDLADKFVFISVQVLNELYSTLSRHKVSHDEIAKLITDLQRDMQVSSITTATINASLKLKEKYHYSWWDSLLLSSALESNCTIIYSEDMQHGQVIENSLKIINPLAGEK